MLPLSRNEIHQAVLGEGKTEKIGRKHHKGGPGNISPHEQDTVTRQVISLHRA